MRTLFAAALGLAGLALAAEPQKPAESKVVYDCRHTGGRAPTIDGQANEDTWRSAEPLRDFTVLRSGKAPRWPTTARLLWDDKHLYVFFNCAIDDIRTTIKKRDEPVWESEAAEIFLCPKGPDAVYYEFNFNPHNAVYDSRLESWKYEAQAKNWRKWADGFNARVKSAAAVRKDGDRVTGWTVEAAVPFADLDVLDGKPPAAGDVWRFNAFRIAVGPKDVMEFAHWQPVQPEFHRPHQFPRLKFVDNVRK